MNGLEFQNSPCILDKNSLDQFPLARQVYARVTYRSCLHEETNAQPTNGFRWTLARTYTTNISPRNHEFNTIGFELAKYIAWPVCQQPPPETTLPADVCGCKTRFSCLSSSELATLHKPADSSATLLRLLLLPEKKEIIWKIYK